MEKFPLLLSVVLVVRNQARDLHETLKAVSAGVSLLVEDYEIIVIDNASGDDSVNVLKRLTGAHGEPNLQVYALTKEVDTDIGYWVGLENALGDFIVVVDPLADDICFMGEMLDQAVRGVDVVFANNVFKPARGWIYRGAFIAFNWIFRYFNGVQLARDAPRYRVLSRRVVNFILQHPQPPLTYRHLPATGGFSRVNLTYRWPPKAARIRPLGESIDLGMRLIVSTTRAPMRLVSSLSLFGAVANVLYSVYVVAIAFFKADVAPGWVSLSLQQSGMFLLLSLVLLMLGEYIINMARLSNEGPLYHVAQEFTSARMTRRERLNVEVVDGQPPSRSGVHS